MIALRTLVAHSLYRRRWLLLSACVLLCADQVFNVAMARSVYNSGDFSVLTALLPNFLREWAGVMMSSFSGLALFGYSHPVVLMFLVVAAISVTTEPAEEIEARFVDVVMARPVPRATVVNRSIVVLVVAMAWCLASMALGSWIGLSLFKPANAPPVEWRMVWLLAGGLGLVVLSWGAIGLAIAAASKRRATALGVSCLLAAAMFILAVLGQFWDAARPYARVSPFYYHEASRIIAGGSLLASDVAVLGAIALAMFAIAHVTYGRRDL